jgi:RecB family exonuclease
VWDDDLQPSAAISIGVALTKRYVSEIATTHEYRAVEVKCTALDIATDHGVVRLTGTTDRVRVTPEGKEGIADIKSGGKAVDTSGRANTKGRHLQTGVYKLMAENALGRTLDAPDEIIGLNTGKTAVGQRVGTAEIADSRTPLLGYDEVPGLIEIAARMLKSGTFQPNPQSYLCSPKYCAGYHKCRFHD